MTVTTAANRDLIRAVDQARVLTDQLFHDVITPDAIYDRPIPARHRIVFYIGHLEAFDWSQACLLGLADKSFNRDFDRLFEFGIDPEVGSLPSDQPADWPKIEEVLKYRSQIREGFDQLAANAPAGLLHIAAEHRLMHAETLTYMLHHLPASKKIVQPQRAIVAGPLVKNDLVDLPTGEATLGLDRSNNFGWDNEFDRRTATVPAFRISRYKISNGEYLEFVKQGGPAPFFWIRDGESWLLRGMFENRPLPLDWPVYVTHEQALAYAKFRGLELPSEEQWHRANGPVPSKGNFDFARWDPEPVTATEGNGWEWTSTLFAPFKGFEVMPTYPTYSANFFDNQHYVIKGGSPRTGARLMRRSFRNWFRPNYPYVYAGFRVVENL